MIQYAVYTSGVTVMVPSLYFMLMGNSALEPVAAGSFITFAGVLLFAFMVFSGAGALAGRRAVVGT